MTHISIIIVNYNTREDLEACLETIPGTKVQPAQNVSKSTETPETVVVDNNSTDGSAEMIHRRFPSVRLVESRENLGFAGGCNAGAAVAGGGHLLLLNSDCRVRPGSIAALSRYLEDHPDAAAAAGRLVDEEDRTQVTFNIRRLPTVWSMIADLLLLHRILPSNPLSAGYRMAGSDHSTPMEVEQPAGACLMIRRPVFERLGGFDEMFHPAWFEDVDLCKRMKLSGQRIVFLPEAVFEHRGGATMSRLDFRQFTLIYYRNMHRYVMKHHRAAAPLIGFAALKGMFFRALLVLCSPVRFSGPVGRTGRREAAGAFFSVMGRMLSGWKEN